MTLTIVGSTPAPVVANQDQRITSVTEYPNTKVVDGKVKPLDTYTNLKYLLDKFDATVRYNLMSRRREVDIPGYKLFREDIQNSAIHKVEYLATLNHLPIPKINQHLETIAGENFYHPIREMLGQNPWDFVPRLDKFIQTSIISTDPELSHQIIKTWMVCAIEAAYSYHGFINHGVLVLQGAQSLGKTRWVKHLDPINCGAVKESAFLDPSNKDSVLQLAKYWINELGELDSIFSKSAIGRIKSYITTQFDDIRKPYGVISQELIRRTVYVATVNEDKYLIDETGNRRWWTVPVTSINLDHGLDMKQIWAEVFYLWLGGHKPYLTKELQLQMDSSNKDYEKISTVKEALLAHFDWAELDPNNPATYREFTVTQILKILGYLNPAQSQCNQLGRLLTEIHGSRGRKTNGLRVHKVPASVRILR